MSRSDDLEAALRNLVRAANEARSTGICSALWVAFDAAEAALSPSQARESERQGEMRPRPDDADMCAASFAETMDTLRDIAVYFRKEAAYECENMGNGGSTITLGKWRRFHNTLENVIQDLPELRALSVSGAEKAEWVPWKRAALGVIGRMMLGKATEHDIAWVGQEMAAIDQAIKAEGAGNE